MMMEGLDLNAATAAVIRVAIVVAVAVSDAVFCSLSPPVIVAPVHCTRWLFLSFLPSFPTPFPLSPFLSDLALSLPAIIHPEVNAAEPENILYQQCSAGPA